MRSYEITERPKHLGGGWNVKFFEDGEPAGGAVFPVEERDPKEGIDWWNSLTEKKRGQWLESVGTAVPADAWHAHLANEAYDEASEQAQEWANPPGRRPHP